MYNRNMPSNSYEIRKCTSCGLRYPLTEGHPIGARCPACMGQTRVILNRQLVTEPKHDRSPKDITPGAHPKRTFSVLLDNIRSAWNVGSILRSADGFGFGHAYLCGITPTPENEAVTKTSLGAEDSVTWSQHKDAVQLVKGLKKEGMKIWVLENDGRAVPINNFTGTNEHGVLILGSEVTGVDPELRDLCETTYYIPMHGEKKSFNVAIAFGIAAYALRNK